MVAGCSKIGFDATNKWPGETDREWGEPITMSDQQLDQHELQQEENKLIAQRKEKLAAVREARAIAFPNDFPRAAAYR